MSALARRGDPGVPLTVRTPVVCDGGSTPSPMGAKGKASGHPSEESHRWPKVGLDEDVRFGSVSNHRATTTNRAADGLLSDPIDQLQAKPSLSKVALSGVLLRGR